MKGYKFKYRLKIRIQFHCDENSAPCFNRHSDLNIAEIRADEEIRIAKYPLRGLAESPA